MTKHPTAQIPALIAALAVNLAVHMRWLPGWLVLGCVAGWIVLLVRIRRGRPAADRRVRRLLTLAGILAVLVGTGGALDRNTAVALLWVLATVKLLEIESRRDVIVTLFLTYFLSVSVVFFSSSLAAGLCVPIGLWVTTAVLVRLHETSGGWRRPLAVSARFLVQALPIAAVLFVFFPRPHGGLWGLGVAGQAVSGFSDVLAPGSVSGLVLSREVAFRVEFDTPAPDLQNLYWRGLTFNTFDGRAWRRTGERARIHAPVAGGHKLRYTISLEPHGRRWLFALDLPIEVQGRVSIRSDYTLRTWREVKRKYTYSVDSQVGYHRAGIPERWEFDPLQLPADGNPRARRLARQLRARAESPTELVDLAMGFFRESGFRYTLNPPLLGADPVDSLLFETRQGYCEHYASAFAFLMRAAGIPARVVAGYQGAEPNPYGDYWIVRQLHAHTWVEVWLPGSGWTRRDPTLEVEPDRITQGAAEALNPEERSTMQPLRGRLGTLSTLLGQLQLGWDAIDTGWHRWVMGYSPERQRAVLHWLGLDADRRPAVALGLLTVTGIGGLLAIGYFQGLLRSDAKTDEPVQQAYLMFCTRLARAGLVRRPHEGPLAYAGRVRAARPELAEEVNEIVERYVQLRYANHGGRRMLRSLRRRIRRFKPRRFTRIDPQRGRAGITP